MTIGSAVNDDDDSIYPDSPYSTPSYSRDGAHVRNDDYSPRSTGDSGRPPRYPRSNSPLQDYRDYSPAGSTPRSGLSRGSGSSGSGREGGGGSGGSRRGGHKKRGSRGTSRDPPTVTVSRNFVMFVCAGLAFFGGVKTHQDSRDSRAPSKATSPNLSTAS